ncbi:MAG: hypothetical protein L6R40_006442 [Gallowayella cf. fulva]|nr:MAG: hypothetical protein L6R40_006442 [Xanthomendoza cf. fulva]
MWLPNFSTRLAFLQLLLLQLLWLSPAAAKKDKPEISSHQLDNAPSNFFYFDDSNTILLHDREAALVHRSEDSGKTWDQVDIRGDKAWDIWRHPHDNKKAYIMGKGDTHWHTNDQGKTWKDFKIPKARPSLFRAPLAFHAKHSDKVLIHGEICRIGGLIDCKEVTFYTNDGFETVSKLRENTRGCIFAHATPEFKTGDEEKDDNRIICVTTGRISFDRRQHRLAVSSNFFKHEEEPNLEGGRTVQGIINIAVVKGYIVAAARAPNTDELAMYVTADASTWHRAVFPSDSRIKEDAYTVLESTPYSIEVDVMTVDPPNPMGVLFTSNSNGTYFTQNIPHTNRNANGIVDFEKVQNIQGIVLVNVVDNWKEVEGSFGRERKKLKSRISFHDGRNFKDLTADGKNLHLHSVSEMNNVGRVFSSSAPGLVMGVGNTGENLKPYEEGDLYVSSDAGLTWTQALEEAHKYEFGDHGSILVAVYDEGPTDVIQYSLNYGKNWHKAELPEGKIRAKALTTTPDSTAMKFFLWGIKGGGSGAQHWVFSIDFEDMHEEKCSDKDFEDWTARVDEDKKAICVMGQKQTYRRRKADADCFIRDKKFDEIKPEFETCKCTKEDFECDYNFIQSKDGKDCVKDGPLPDPKGVCKSGTKKYKATSGFRKIPGNGCEGGEKLDEEIERDCEDTLKPIVSGEINTERTAFPGKSFRGYFYLERTESSSSSDKADKDETVVMRTDNSKVYITRDHGKTWDQILKGEEVKDIYPHPHFNDACYFVTPSKTVHYTINRGDTFGHFEAKSEPTRDRDLPALGFHADYKDYLIWTGAVGCDKKGDCHNDAWYSTDRGGNWEYLRRVVRKCEFIREEGRGDKKKLVYCEQFKDEKLGGPLELQSSDNWFADKQTKFENIVDFATMSEFIIVATKDQSDGDSLKVDASVDGQTFADALFPSNFNVPIQKAYTVLDSHTHAVFMHVTVGNQKDAEYGSIIKSNSNGTSYVLSLDNVNRNTPGYVDFEKMLGLEGVALVNIVANVEDAEKGSGKKLKTMITHNDGAEWSLIKAPQNDPEGKSYACSTDNVASCSLHLHGYTERRDPRDVFSSPSAVGLMMAVGNVGEYLTTKSEKTSDTFITRDGGLEWQAVKKGNYMWEYGDQGSIIVIVRDTVATDEIFYSLDEGAEWIPFKFSNKKVHIAILSTVPSDNSLNFLLWGREEDSDSEIVTFNLDFSQLKERSKQCKLDENNPTSDDSDYYLWEPKHPAQDNNCLFGHIAQYHRKIPERQCFNGRSIQHLHKIAKNCECTRSDFECDYNYEPAKDGSCKLVAGLEPPDHSKVCKEDSARISYFLPTGYRRIPLSTCEGGNELEKYESKEVPCQGHEKDYEEAHRGLGGFWIFILAVVLPLGIASAVGYWVWQNWHGKFGSIRLGDSGSPFDADQPWIKYPVAAVSGIVAVLAALPLLIGSLWRWGSGLFGGGRRYTTRGSFARGRGDYAVVDEDELLGEDEDEEV